MGQTHADNAFTHRVKLLVGEDGMFVVTQQDLAQRGMDIADLHTAGLNLSQDGAAVPFLIQDNRLVFYGQAPHSRYTNVRPYILESGQEGSTIQLVDAPNISSPIIAEIPQTLHLEENLLYKAEARKDSTDDVWFWAELSQRETFITSVDILYASEASGRIRVNSWGLTNLQGVEGDHSVDLLVNDKLVDNIVWDGQTHYRSDTTLPMGVLKQGKNKIALDNHAEGASFLDIMHVNWIELDYQTPAIAVDDRLTFSTVEGLVKMSGFSAEPLIFNISNPAKPELLTGWEYGDQQAHVPVEEEMVIAAFGPYGYKTPAIEPMRESNWRNPEQQADLIIITTDELAPSLIPLVEAREDQNINVALVHVADVYDEFGYGSNSPESIREFVAYAFSEWQQPVPRYLFLVGDATTDYLGHVSELPANVVPSIMVPVQFSGETVSDSRLADVDGDRRPNLAVGRWPIGTAADVDNLVKRTLAYEQGHAGDNAIFAADGSEARFGSIVERLTKISQIPEEQIQLLNGPQTEDLIEQWNEGAWLATYVGHGSITRWGKDDILDVETVDKLKSDNPPIVLQLTCLTGLFAHPDETSLTEAMLLDPKGPVLTVAATSLTLSGHQEPFAIQLLQQMQDSNIRRIGDAFQAAKLSLEIDDANGLREISDTFALFGDPSTPIVRP